MRTIKTENYTLSLAEINFLIKHCGGEPNNNEVLHLISLWGQDKEEDKKSESIKKLTSGGGV